MRIKTMCLSDIPNWVLLSREHDSYVKELVPDLTEWYEGNETSMSYDDYMKAKISKNEAFMATGGSGACCGIAAISKNNNNITFFGVSHKCDFFEIGNLLLNHALPMLNPKSNIKTNIIRSTAEQIQKQYTLFNRHGFVFSHDDLENGVPVSCLVRNGE